MNFTLNIEINASRELLDTLKAFSGLATAPKPEEVTPKPSTNGKAVVEAVKPEVAEKQPEKAAPKPEPVAEKQEPAAEESNISIEQLRRLVSDKAKEGHRDAIKALLKEMGASNVTTLDKARYSEFKSKVEAL